MERRITQINHGANAMQIGVLTINSSPPVELEPQGGRTWGDVPLAEIEERLQGVRRHLFRVRLSIFTSRWFVGGMAGTVSMGVLFAYITLTRAPGAALWLVMLAGLLSTASFAMHRLALQRQMHAYVIADLKAEIRELERIVALRRAGRL